MSGNIPITDIPNGPNLAGPTLISPGSVNGNLASSAGNFMRNTVNPNAFSGEAEGLQNLGESGVRAGAALDDFSKAMARANDVAVGAKVGNILDTTYKDHLAKMEADGVPPEQWGAKWSDSLAQAKKQVGQISMSPAMQREVQARMISWGGETTRQVNFAATRQHIENNKEDVVLSFDRYYQNGQYEDLFHAIDTAEAAHYLSPVDAKEYRQKYQQLHVNDTMEGAIMADPRGMADKIDQAINGKETDLDQMVTGNKQTLAFWANKVKGALRTEATQTFYNIYQGVQAGDIVTKEDIDKADAKKVLNPYMLKSAYKWLPQPEQKYDPQTVSQIQTAIAGVHPNMDDGLKTYADIYGAIGTVPNQGVRGKLMEDLEKAYKGTERATDPQSATLKEKMFSRIDTYGKQNLLGMPNGIGSDGKTVTDQAQNGKYWAYMTGLKMSFTKYLQDNPGLTADKANEWFNNQVGEQIRTLEASKPTTTPSNWNPVNWFNHWGTGNAVPQEAKQWLQQKQAQPDVTPKPSASLGGEFQGHDQIFDDAAQKYGLDPALLKAIAAHETGNGTSHALKAYNNPGGLMDPNSKESKGFQKFASIEDGVDAMASLLKRKYIDKGLTSIEAIQKKYSPVGAANDPGNLNKDWVNGVSSYYRKFSPNA